MSLLKIRKLTIQVYILRFVLFDSFAADLCLRLQAYVNGIIVLYYGALEWMENYACFVFSNNNMSGSHADWFNQDVGHYLCCQYRLNSSFSFWKF